MKAKIKPVYYIAFLIIYLEIIFKILVLKNIELNDILYTAIFSIPKILFLGLICMILKGKAQKITIVLISCIITLYFLVQLVFFKLFSVPFSFSTLGLAEGALGFTDIILDAIKSYFFYIVAFIVPICLYIPLRKKISSEKESIKVLLITATAVILTFAASLCIIVVDKKGIYSPYNLYYKIDAPEKNIKKFGLLTATKIDLKRTIFGFQDNLIIATSVKEEKEPVEYGLNTMDINFEELKNSTKDRNLINVYNYMESIEPSKQNEYTGYFKDKNLIFILAEGFNSIAVDKTLTPTLYKLVNSGFVFENFYSPVFLSTTGGEFQATTGLIPSQPTLKLWKETKPTIQFALGNTFTKEGYTGNAYHNWTYNYYSREKTMPTLGFNSYLGLGNGLEKFINYKWLPSDIELIDTTVGMYINNEKFITYYITVSGHAPYVISLGNSIALKNKDLVKDLEYSNTIKAYLATQIELDRALELLINKLQEAGKLDDTVIALVGDHYPYTISVDEINTVSNFKRDEIVEVNRSNFIIWNSEMKEPIKVEKVGSQIDVLPTLLNLFGIEYDSRLIIGQDILSSKEGTAIFSNRSWVSDLGTYFSATETFEPKEGKEIPEGYVDSKNLEVANKFTMSNLFIKYKIYDKIFK